MSKLTIRATLLAAAVGLAAAGCEQSSPPPAAPKATTGSAEIPSSILLAQLPEGARPVEEVKPTAKTGDTVTLRGRIGGSMEPMLPNRAIFQLMGPGLPACSDNPEDKCTTPWDYCCESKADIARHLATVEIAGPDGNVIRKGVKGTAGLKELSEVVVVGTVTSAEGPNFVVRATGLHVVKP